MYHLMCGTYYANVDFTIGECTAVERDQRPSYRTKKDAHYGTRLGGHTEDSPEAGV